ncbi:hypothetical protein BUE80_DR011353 [Diplocarpon rosae]|nr:hypothetical protein BUE80_DR011353 [Diplocarpon rosae]
MTDGLGETKAGPNTLAGMAAVMAPSGDVLPYHRYGCLFPQGTKLQIMPQVPGQRGNIAVPRQPRFTPRILVKMGLMKRASNVNEDYPTKAAVPAGTTCTGTVGGQQNVCLVKMANPPLLAPLVVSTPSK